MLSHITLRVHDLQKSKEFFATAFAPLGYKVLIETERSIGFGIEDADGKRDFWIKAGGEPQGPHSFSCIAFLALNKQAVEDFYHAALAAGGADNGAPGYRTKYYPGYYAAYVFDLDGHNIEVIFDDPNPSA